MRAMLAPLDTDVAIETPEHIVFHHRVAGPARRLLAYALDLLLCYGALFVLLLVIVLASAGAGGVTGAFDSALGAGIGLWLVMLFATQWVYFALLEAWRGTTPGKRALGLRVVTLEGRPIGFRAAALRNILRAADSLPITIAGGAMASLFGGLASVTAGASMTLTTRFQRLGDLVAGTMVIVDRDVVRGGPLGLWPPAGPEEQATLPDVVTLDADERHAIELFLRRRPRLGRAREQELAAMIAPKLAARFGVRYGDPSRLLALLYDRAANAGRSEAPPSSRGAESWR